MEDPISQFAKRFNWSEQNVRIALRAGFRCTYCGKDILDSVDTYFLWTVDHVYAKKASNDDTEDNLVLACRIGNVNLKGQWTPPSAPKDALNREHTLAEAKDYVQRRRAEQEKRVADERAAARKLIEDIRTLRGNAKPIVQ
jgi:5-methylcytosine-specific restriction endonuclease McrA